MEEINNFQQEPDENLYQAWKTRSTETSDGSAPIQAQLNNLGREIKKDPEREFRSSRNYFKTPSLDESRSPDFNLFSDQEEYSEEEVAKTIAKTMEQYMSKTRTDNGSRIARPKIEDKDSFELKRQFLKELHDNTFSGSDHEDANEHFKKVLEIVDLFYIPNITIDQVMLRAFHMTRSTETSDGSAAIQAQLNNLGREIKKVNEKCMLLK
nr:hypothetical protein [Tanacetum cinerariifolium]